VIDPLLHQMVKTASILKTESERADTPESLSRVERLASLLYVQAAEARAALEAPKRLGWRADAYQAPSDRGLLN
jgi:hypothetical protein